MASNRTDTQAVVNLVINGKQAMTSLKELTDTQRRLNTELRNMRPSDPGYRDRLRELQMINRAMQEQQAEIRGLNTESSKLKTNWKDIATGIAGGLGLSLGLSTLKDLGAQVFEVTARFQKLEAVLTTTLGSKSSAQLAMKQIQKLAAETPFAVDELTEAYVKLANRGFRPTMEQMVKLGDLAASTGKSFDQLVEAQLDAETGEFERLKEFGVRASKNGDTVSFAFKGITKEVEFTSSAIREYLISLGDAEGISGSMAGISETLSGKVSNLGDSWDSLLKTVGDETTGTFTGAISIMGQAINAMDQYLNDLNIAQKYNAPGSSFWDRVGGAMSSLQPGKLNMAQINRRAFASVSQGLDDQIGGAKYFRELNDIQRDLIARMKVVDRTTQEGAASYQLYADKIKLIKDRSKDIATDREREQLVKQSDAAKKAASEQEKLDKAQQKRHDQEVKRLIKEHDALKELGDKMVVDFEIKDSDGLEKKLLEISKKYDPLIKKAKEFKDNALASVFEDTKKKETTKAESDSILDSSGKIQKSNDQAFKGGIDWLGDEFNREKNANNSQLADDLAGVNTEEAQLSLKEAAQLREREITEQHLISMKLLYETYGKDATSIDTQLTAIRIANAEREAAGKIAATQAKQQIDQAYLESASEATTFLKGLVKQQSLAYKGLIIADKALAIAKIIVNNQAEISGYYAKYALIPGGTIIASGLAAASKVRAGISMGIVAATGIGELIASSSGNKTESGNAHANGIRNVKAGQALVGEAGPELIEANGKYWLAKEPTLADLPQGANVYNANETIRMMNNRSLGERIYPQTNYSIDSDSARAAEMQYRSPYTAPQFATSSSSNVSQTQLGNSNDDFNRLSGIVSRFIESQSKINERPVILDYSILEKFKNEIDDVRLSQSG